MRRLSDGHFCVLLEGGGVAVRGATVANVGSDERAAVVALARGSDDELESPLPLVDSDAPDAVLERKLQRLGRGFAWHLAGLEQGPSLSKALRDVAARARVFGSLTSLPLLPESAAGVALRLQPDLANEDEVLVHGGQLFVGLALALGGQRVTVWSDDEADRDLTRALAAEGWPLEAREADVLAPLDADLRGRFRLVLVDTLAAPQQETTLLSRAMGATKDGGRVVVLVHSMRRPLTRRLLAELPVTLEEPLHEVAVRLHPGWAPAEFSWDEWILSPTEAPPVDVDQRLSAASARDLDPSEQAHGCVEVQGLSRDGITPEALDRALSLFTSAAGEPPPETGKHDDERHLLRYLALPGGGQAAISVDKETAVASLDIFPWSPALLAALVSALLVEVPRADEEGTHER